MLTNLHRQKCGLDEVVVCLASLLKSMLLSLLLSSYTERDGFWGGGGGSEICKQIFIYVVGCVRHFLNCSLLQNKCDNYFQQHQLNL